MAGSLSTQMEREFKHETGCTGSEKSCKEAWQDVAEGYTDGWIIAGRMTQLWSFYKECHHRNGCEQLTETDR